jgi:pimeloyl-ACP methyl ester carboxylesterase
MGRVSRCVVTAALVAVAATWSVSASSSASGAVRLEAAASARTAAKGARGDVARRVDIGGRTIYLRCRGTKNAGRPTIILMSGYHDSSDVWTKSDVLGLLPPAVGPPVFQALATTNHVCVYDRPGTLRYVTGTPLTTRSTAVPQPRTAQDVVEELHTLLDAARVPGPYVLVGHSLGGLFVLLYAKTYPEQVRAIVFDDAFSPTVPAVFGSLWPTYRDGLLNPPLDEAPLESLRSPDSERIDLDASAAQVEQAQELPAMPLVVLTKTASFAGLDPVPPGITADEINTLYEQAENYFVALAPTTPHIFATGSDHYIQFSQPDLIVQSTKLVLGRIGG